MSPAPETTLGGRDRHFPDTAWSVVVHSAGDDAARRRKALEDLCRDYWRPVYHFVRATFGVPVEDAKDLTQDFFAYLLDGEVLTKYEQERGRFRNFLKGVLRNFLSDARKTLARKKRGGTGLLLPLDADRLGDADVVFGSPPPETPEEVFDREWASGLIRDSVGELRARLQSSGQETCWKVYEAYQAAQPSGPSPTYRSVAGILELTEHQVKHLLEDARARLHDIVRRRVRESVASRNDLTRELNDLFGG